MSLFHTLQKEPSAQLCYTYKPHNSCDKLVSAHSVAVSTSLTGTTNFLYYGILKGLKLGSVRAVSHLETLNHQTDNLNFG